MSAPDANSPGGSSSRQVSRSTQTGASSSSSMSNDSQGGAAGAGGNPGARGAARGRNTRGGTGRNRGSRGRSRGARFNRRRPVRLIRSRSAQSMSSRGGSPPSRPSSAGSGGGGGGRMPHRSPTLINDTETICPICHNQITNLCITDCNHRFCRDCIRRWTSRNATCPSCRTNIRTILHILPGGGTETILISRAELLAHKVNEIHSILMILFTVISHTLLPEVSNYLDQLNQIARELNVPTTSSRMGNVAAAADAAAAELATTNSPAARSAGVASAPSSPAPQATRPATQSPASPTVSSQASQPTSQTGSQPANQTGSQPTSQAVTRLLNQRGSQTGSLPASQTGSQPANQTGSQPTSQAPTRLPNQTGSQTGSQATSRTGSQPASQTGGQQSQTEAPRGALPSSLAALRGAIGGGLIFAPRAATPGSSSRATSGSAATRADSGYSSEISDNPGIRHTYLTANQSAATNPAAAAASSPSSPAQQQSGQESPRSLSILGARNFILRAAASRRQTAPSTPSPATRSQISQQQAIDRTRGQPPSPEELARAQEQRQRDIRFLTDSYNKINQVYEVLMIMHMVIHRNQVELDPLPPSSTSDADLDSD